jgi:hypothetical protein
VVLTDLFSLIYVRVHGTTVEQWNVSSAVLLEMLSLPLVVYVPHTGKILLKGALMLLKSFLRVMNISEEGFDKVVHIHTVTLEINICFI